MQAIVYRTGQGAVGCWPLAGGQDAPEGETLPDVELGSQVQLLRYKGPGMSWLDWGRYLSAHPELGDWAVEDVPELATPHDALGYVRARDTARAAFGS